MVAKRNCSIQSRARDHGISDVLSHLTGSTVELTGRKADGTPYGPRLLEDVSFVPTRSGVGIIGHEPGVGIRQFILDGVTKALVRTTPSERASHVGAMAHVSEWMEISGVTLDALRASIGDGQ